jgi:hypothetical protein
LAVKDPLAINAAELQLETVKRKFVKILPKPPPDPFKNRWIFSSIGLK